MNRQTYELTDRKAGRQTDCREHHPKPSKPPNQKFYSPVLFSEFSNFNRYLHILECGVWDFLDSRIQGSPQLEAPMETFSLVLNLLP